jgi:hypothetical protein
MPAATLEVMQTDDLQRLVSQVWVQPDDTDAILGGLLAAIAPETPLHGSHPDQSRCTSVTSPSSAC